MVLVAESRHLRMSDVIDGMSLVQNMKGNDQAFSKLADSALTHILHEGVTGSMCSSICIDKTRPRTQRDRIGVRYRNTVPKLGARSPDPAMEKLSQQLGQ